MTTETETKTTTEIKPETKPAKRSSRAARMRSFFMYNPTASVREAATLFGTTYQIAYMIRKDMLGKVKKVKRVKKAVAVKAPVANKPDVVNHPPHYKVGGIETIDFIKAKLTPQEFRGYLLGNVLKYASRAGHKGNSAQDMGKMAWYASRLSELEK